jgi:streptogramin lyase
MRWPFRCTTVRPVNPHRFRPEVLALESRWVPSTITEFQLPPLATGAHIGAANVTAGPDGNVWFTDPAQSEVGRISPSGQVTEFPTIGNPPGAITSGPDGNLWFVGNFIGGSVGRITPDGQATEFALPNAFAQPVAITAGPDGNVWFTADTYPTGEFVGRVTPTGQITEFAIPVPSGVSGSAAGITAGPDGNLYFLHDGVLARITPTGQITDHVADAVGVAITAGPDGNLWTAGTLFNTQTGAVLGGFVDRISLTGSVTPFSLGGASTAPASIRPGPDGNLWFTEPGANQIGRITPAGQIAVFTVPTAGSQPTAITAGPNGNMWFTEATGRRIGEYFLTGTPPAGTAATATALSADVATPVVGQTVHLTATVTSTSGTPTGTVTFFDGSTAIGTQSLDGSGHAVLATAFGSSGSHTLTAVFDGTTDFAPSLSAAIKESVNVAATTTTLSATPSPVVSGQQVVLTATVTPTSPGAGVPTGIVEFSVDGNVIGFAELDASGKAVLKVTTGQTGRHRHPVFSPLGRGTHVITATYEGDGNFAASLSAGLNLMVV